MGVANRIRNLSARIQQHLGLPTDFEEQIYAALLQKGDTCFDVGANYGEVSLFLSRRAGPNGKIFSFEPVWPVYQSLCANIYRRFRTNGSAPVIPIPYGVSDSDGSRSIQVPNDSFGMASLATGEEWALTQGDATIKSYQCSFVSLDSFVAVRKLEIPQFIKIDVEGAELLVLKGATKVLERHPLMLIEVFAPWEKAFGYGPWDVLGLLKQIGYCFLFACPGGLVEYAPSKENPFPPEYENGYNVIAFVPNRHANRMQRLDSLRRGKGKMLPMAPPPQLNRI